MDAQVPGAGQLGRCAAGRRIAFAGDRGAPGTNPGHGFAACSPVPAIVLTVFAVRSTLRSRWFSVSATYSVSPVRASPADD